MHDDLAGLPETSTASRQEFSTETSSVWRRSKTMRRVGRLCFRFSLTEKAQWSQLRLYGHGGVNERERSKRIARHLASRVRVNGAICNPLGT
jgi:hypothetical protein